MIRAISATVHKPAADVAMGGRASGRAVARQEPRPPGRSDAREAAGLLASQLFFAPMLAEMRKLPFGREFGHGGRAEEVFGEQLDQRMADIVARSDASLVEHLSSKLGPTAA